MNGEFYVQIMGCVLITAFTALVVCVAIWFATIVYDDFIQKRDLRRWKKRPIGDKL